MANITKHDLIQEISKSTGFIRADIKKVVEEFLNIVSEALVQNQTIEIRGFGTFACKERKARPARNPRTGKEVLLADRLVPSFKFSSEIKSKINQYDFDSLIQEISETETIQELVPENI
ncbi:MAG: integration host factor subunit beta [Fibrobacteraceae bacterium]|nr:integration host factor subunit beta [Fibrobacteraceae bacterium]